MSNVGKLRTTAGRTSNVETYSREVEQTARKLAQTHGSSQADRRALAVAVKRDAQRIFEYVVSTNVRSAKKP